MPKFTCTSVVLRPQVTWFAAAGSEPRFHATPIWARNDLNRVVLSAQTLWFQNRSEGTVLWQGTMTEQTARTMGRALVGQLRARDCTVSEAGLETGWFTVLHPAYPAVHFGLGPLISQSRTTFGGLRDDPQLLASRLARYADVTGAVWRGTGGLSGCASIRSLHEATPRTGVPLWNWAKKPEGIINSAFELKPRHGRPLTPDERRLPFVHQFDIRAMYLAAAGVAMVGWSAPEHSGPREFDPGRAGYWQVRCDQLADVPDTVRTPASVRSANLMWLTTPVMSYLAERGHSLEVFDSWTCDRTGRYLRSWAERLTAARRSLSPAHPVDSGVLDAVKDTYARTIGMLQRPGGRIYRPDWRDCVVDTARINLIRKVKLVEPVRYNVDSVWVPCEGEDPRWLGEQLGTDYTRDGAEIDQVGKFKHVTTLTVEQYLAKYEPASVKA